MCMTIVLLLLVAVVSVHCSFKLKGNVTLDCQIYTYQPIIKSIKAKMTLIDNSQSAGYDIIYWKCLGSLQKCLRENNAKIVKAPCLEIDQDRCKSFSLRLSEVWFYSVNYGIRIFQHVSKQGNKTLVHEDTIGRNDLLNNCFADVSADMALSPGKSPFSVAISWSLQIADLHFLTETFLKVSVFSYSTGRFLHVKNNCGDNHQNYKLQGTCEIPGLVPCHKYRICMKTQLFDGDSTSNRKTTTCKPYKIKPQRVIAPVANLEIMQDPVQGVSRFSWVDSAAKREPYWFFNTTVQFFGKQNTTLSNVTDQTVLELVPYAGAEGCSLSVAKCVTCSCSRAVVRHFDKCGMSSKTPKTSERNHSDKEERAVITWSCVLILVIAVLIIVLVWRIRNISSQRNPPMDDSTLPVLEEILPRPSSSLYSFTLFPSIDHESEDNYSTLNSLTV